RKHDLAGAGRTGGARDRGEIWWRSLCRLADGGGWTGADLYRPASGHLRHDRQGFGPVLLIFARFLVEVPWGSVPFQDVKENRMDAQPDRQGSMASDSDGAGIFVEAATVTYRNG